MTGTNSKVICWHNPPDAENTGVPLALWDRLQQEGWLDFKAHPPHVVIQVSQASRSPLVLATARSLAARLSDLTPGTTIEILDHAAAPQEWDALPVRRLVTEETLRVAAIAVPQGVLLPRLWFESFVLITVTGVSPSTTSRVASILDAQAEPLFQLGNSGVSTALVYEAHRLAASDLAIACCPTESQVGASGAYWAASTSDTALEQAILTSAGISPNDAPHFRELLRHEIPPPPPRVEGHLPPLHALAAPAWEVRREALQSKVRASSHVLVQDMRNLQGNLHKIPAFVRRQVQTWRSQRSGA